MLKDLIEKQKKNYKTQFKIKKNIKGFNWKKKKKPHSKVEILKII
jgi:hypothetical protein